MALGRRLRSALATACGVALLGAGLLAGNPIASADPLSDAQAKLNQIEAERATIEQDYNESQIRLEDAKTQQAQLSSDIAAVQAKVDGMLPAVVWIVTAQQQGGDVGLAASFLLADSDEQFLSQLATTASVTSLIDQVLTSYVIQQDRLKSLKTSMTATLETIKAEVAQQATLLKQAKAKEAAAQQVVNRLTAQQQAALADLQNPPIKSGAPGIVGEASPRALAAATYALAQRGKPYVFAASGPNAFDCSGLAMAAYRTIGISLPHSAHLQYAYGTPVAKSDLRPGDLLFFYNPIRHVAIYIGNGMMVHASTPATGVKVGTITSSGPYVGARRLA